MLINYTFRNTDLLKLALTHPSSKQKNNIQYNYQRLEFLGDRVLSMAISDILYHTYADLNEGSLSIIQSNLVNTETIAKIAKFIALGDDLIIDAGEEMIGGRENPRNLENAMEALIAAVYLDSNYLVVKNFIAELWKDFLTNKAIINKNCKNVLQEWAQKLGMPLPIYNIENKEGAAHSPIFTVSVYIEGYQKVYSDAKSKKEAENKAAKLMLHQLNITE